MNRSTLSLALCLVCLAILMVAQIALRPDVSQRNYDFMPEMVHSVAGESQGQFAGLPDGLVDAPLVAGVVPRGARPYRYGTSLEEEQRAGRELANPFTDEPEILARGAEVYRVFCVVCHGADGAGRGPVVLRGLPPPTSLSGANARAMSDGQMFHVLTRGRNNMASYAAQVSIEDRWKVIRHVRKLQETPQ
ncbi:MAG: cytochrome c [bacterium]|nr:cytochrome c [bacterium]